MADYDYLVVGAGMYGAVFARQMTDSGKSCLVIDRRAHIAGNCFTEEVESIQVHRYGPHVFHTDSKRIWDYVQRYAEFNSFTYRPRACFKGRIFSFPINLLTLHQLWGVNTPGEAEAVLRSVRENNVNVQTMEGWLLSQVGRELYETFYRGYSTKQWGRDPCELPSSIAARVPIRTTFNDCYYNDRYQGIPVGGYTRLVERVLDGIDVRLSCDYFSDVPFFQSCARKVVYTGPIDEYFGYCRGRLEYRSLRFEHDIYEGDYQGVAGINYTDLETPYTRVVEHKHFGPDRKSDVSVITREYPIPASERAEPFYPVNDAANARIYEGYKKMAHSTHTLFGGRLAAYRYYDMHHVIGQAIATAQREIEGVKQRGVES